MIDSHCHLDHSPLYENLTDVLNRAKSKGVNYFLTICTNLKSFENIKNIVNSHNEVYGTIGIHPHEANLNLTIDKNYLIQNKKREKKIVGIGETGLDYFYENSDKKSQIKLFIEHIEASIELNIPIIVHSRDAENDTFNILNDYKSKNPKILMHCFTGSKNFSTKLLDIGAYFSASGIITFKKTESLQDTFKNIPNDKLLIETDSPFLAPIPKRGFKNEPSFIEHTALKLSKIKKISLNDIITNTTKNFNDLFSLTL